MARHGAQREYEYTKLSEMPAILEGRHLIYDNGGAQIWAPKSRLILPIKLI